VAYYAGTVRRCCCCWRVGGCLLLPPPPPPTTPTLAPLRPCACPWRTLPTPPAYLHYTTRGRATCCHRSTYSLHPHRWRVTLMSWVSKHAWQRRRPAYRRRNNMTACALKTRTRRKWRAYGRDAGCVGAGCGACAATGLLRAYGRHAGCELLCCLCASWLVLCLLRNAACAQLSPYLRQAAGLVACRS